MKQHENLNSVMETGNHLKNRARVKNQRKRGNLMQKTFLFFIVFCFSVASAFAQDIITLKSGEDIQALVQEIGDVDVKYKKFDNPNGPNYSLKKSEIFIIRYANGSKDVFVDNNPEPVKETATTPSVTTTIAPVVTTQPVPTMAQQNVQRKSEEVYLKGSQVRYSSNKSVVANVEDLFFDVPEALKNYNSGKTLKTVANSIGWGGCSMVIYSLYIIIKEDGQYSDPWLYVGGGMAIAGIIIHAAGSSKMKTAVEIYNASVRRQHSSDLSLNFGLTRSGGIGFTLNF